MTNSKVDRDKFIVLQGWMISELGLKGNELIVYACIYGFTQAENQVFNGSLQYLADWTNSTKQGVIRCLKSLVEKGYIQKNDRYVNGVKFCEYYATNVNTLLNKVEYPIKQSLIPPIQESLPNNTDINNTKNNIANKKDIYISEFEQLWALYPNKKGKDKALSCYIKARDKGVEFETVKQGILDYSKECEIKKREKQYIQHGSTWFNNSGWNDEYDFTAPYQAQQGYQRQQQSGNVFLDIAKENGLI